MHSQKSWGSTRKLHRPGRPDRKGPRSNMELQWKLPTFLPPLATTSQRFGVAENLVSFCPPSPSVCGRTSEALMSLKPAAPWSAAPSIVASLTSTSPTTTDLPTAQPKKTSARYCVRTLVCASILAACATNSSSPLRPVTTCGLDHMASAPRANTCLLHSMTASSAWASITSTSFMRIALGRTAPSKKPWVLSSQPCMRARLYMLVSLLTSRIEHAKPRRSSRAWECRCSFTSPRTPC